MRKLKIMEHISLDGVIQHSADDGDFPYGDWTAPYRTPAGRDAILAAHGESFDLLLGRRTYDLWSGFWPKAPGGPMADGINAAKKYVATHRPESLEWAPFKAFRTVGSDIFFCRIEAVRHRTAGHLWPVTRPHIVGATAKQQIETPAVRGEDFLPASRRPIGRGPVAIGEIAVFA